MNWVLFNGAMVYLDARTQTRIMELDKRALKTPKDKDHIPPFVPKVATFGIEEVNECVLWVDKKIKGEKKKVEEADWKRLVIS